MISLAQIIQGWLETNNYDDWEVLKYNNHDYLCYLTAPGGSPSYNLVSRIDEDGLYGFDRFQKPSLNLIAADPDLFSKLKAAMQLYICNRWAAWD